MELGQYLPHRWPFAIAMLHLRVPLPETDNNCLEKKKWQQLINL